MRSKTSIVVCDSFIGESCPSATSLPCVPSCSCARSRSYYSHIWCLTPHVWVVSLILGIAASRSFWLPLCVEQGITYMHVYELCASFLLLLESAWWSYWLRNAALVTMLYWKEDRILQRLTIYTLLWVVSLPSFCASSHWVASFANVFASVLPGADLWLLWDCRPEPFHGLGWLLCSRTLEHNLVAAGGCEPPTIARRDCRLLFGYGRVRI